MNILLSSRATIKQNMAQYLFTDES